MRTLQRVGVGHGKNVSQVKEILSLVRVVDQLWKNLCRKIQKNEFFKGEDALIPWCWVGQMVLSLFSRMSSGTTYPATLSELSLLWSDSSERSFLDPSTG